MLKIKTEDAKEYVKNQMDYYLQKWNLSKTKPFNCINPDHADTTPSMSYDKKRNKLHCFGCNADYDVFDLVAIDYNLTDNKEIFKKAYELFGIETDNNKSYSYTDTHSCVYTPTYTQEEYSNKEDYSKFYKDKNSNVSNTNYLKNRGLSDEVIDKFLLGYDDKYKGKNTGGTVWKAVIIPTSKSTYTIRNVDPNADKNNRFRKVGNNIIYNSGALENSAKHVFVLESEIDALSVIEASGNAIGLGSTANVNNLIELLKNKNLNKTLILSLDNDDSGKKATKELIRELDKLDIRYIIYNIAGECKDPNEALIKDRNTFKEEVNKAILKAQEKEDSILKEQKEEYLKTSTYNYIQDFIDGVNANANTPFISTGFKNLDERLDGGLFEGFYVFGAISSLGKTTFITQMADQIAQNGTDVLIFSLEMARTEIISKSISRLTRIKVIEKDLDLRLAKTSRGITTGSRWKNYDNEQKQFIKEAVNEYAKYAKNIYINEGIGDIGAKQIREAVEKHIKLLDRKPVVIIDYVQILAPYNDRSTDKQNMDKSVLELKRMSRDFKIPVIGISSFNRANYKSTVDMESFKESGAIEYSSDVLIGLQFKGVSNTKEKINYQDVKNKDPREVELRILKNRNGALGEDIEFEYYPMFNYFKEINTLF